MRSWLYLTWILRFYKITIIFNLTLLPLNLTLHPLVQSWLPLCLSKGEWRITWECIHTDRGTISVFLWRYFGRNLSLPTVGGRILGWPLVSHSLANVLFLHVGGACDWLQSVKCSKGEAVVAMIKLYYDCVMGLCCILLYCVRLHQRSLIWTLKMWSAMVWLLQYSK